MTIIRKADLYDVDVITEVGRLSFLESHGHSATAADIEAYVSQTYTPLAVREELENTANIYYLIYHNDRVAGYSKITLNDPNENIAAINVTCLARLYLLKEFYGHKLGAKLLEHNILLSKHAQQAGIWLHTWIENRRAIAFYQKSGFQIVGKYDFKISGTHANPNHVMYLEYAR